MATQRGSPEKSGGASFSKTVAISFNAIAYGKKLRFTKSCSWKHLLFSFYYLLQITASRPNKPYPGYPRIAFGYQFLPLFQGIVSLPPEPWCHQLVLQPKQPLPAEMAPLLLAFSLLMEYLQLLRMALRVAKAPV